MAEELLDLFRDLLRPRTVPSNRFWPLSAICMIFRIPKMTPDVTMVRMLSGHNNGGSRVCNLESTGPTLTTGWFRGDSSTHPLRMNDHHTNSFLLPHWMVIAICRYFHRYKRIMFDRDDLSTKHIDTENSYTAIILQGFFHHRCWPLDHRKIPPPSCLPFCKWLRKKGPLMFGSIKASTQLAQQLHLWVSQSYSVIQTTSEGRFCGHSATHSACRKASESRNGSFKACFFGYPPDSTLSFRQKIHAVKFRMQIYRLQWTCRTRFQKSNVSWDSLHSYLFLL